MLVWSHFFSILLVYAFESSGIVTHGTGFVSFGRAERARKRINQKLVIADAAVTPGSVRTKLGGGDCRAQKLRAGRLAGEAGAGCGAGGGVRVEAGQVHLPQGLCFSAFGSLSLLLIIVSKLL